MMLFTQITMEAAEDPEFLLAMRKAHIRGALVGIETITEEGLKASTRDSTAPGRTWWRGCIVRPAPCPHPRLVHLRPADRSARHLRGHGRARARGGAGGGAIHHPHPVSRHVDFQQWEKRWKARRLMACR